VAPATELEPRDDRSRTGEHLAHLLAWALQNRMTIEQMLGMPYYHPVLEEGLRTALHDVNAKLRVGRRAGSESA
jgi:hypothetical protein